MICKGHESHHRSFWDDLWFAEEMKEGYEKNLEDLTSSMDAQGPTVDG